MTDVRNLEKWVDGMSDVRPTSGGEFGVGSTYAATYACGGRPGPIECEVTEFVPMRTQTIRSTKGPFPFEGTLELEETEGGTRVRNTITAGSDSGFKTFMFTVLAPLCRRMMRKQLAKELDCLKDEMEAVGLPS